MTSTSFAFFALILELALGVSHTYHPGHSTEESMVADVLGELSKYPGHVTFANFHDYDTGYMAFKDTNKQICILSLAPVITTTPNNHSKDRLGQNITPLQMTHDAIVGIAGEKIADFCENHNTYFRTLHPSRKEKRFIIGDCADTISNCDSYGSDACNTPDYYFWIIRHCATYCGYCTRG